MELVGWSGREDMGRPAAGEKCDQDRLKRDLSGLHYPKAHPPYTAKDLQSCFLESLHRFPVASSAVQRGLQPGSSASLQVAPQSREICSPEPCTTCR